MKAQRDLTAERKDTLARIDFDALPLADAMKEVRGNGATVCWRSSATPTAPTAGGSKPTLATLSDVTIYTFLMPMVSLHPAGAARPSPSGARRIASPPGTPLM